MTEQEQKLGNLARLYLQNTDWLVTRSVDGESLDPRVAAKRAFARTLIDSTERSVLMNEMETNFYSNDNHLEAFQWLLSIKEKETENIQEGVDA